MSTEVLSDYIDQLLAGRAAPLQEYLLRHPEREPELVRLLAMALLAHEAIAGIAVDAHPQSQSKERAVQELERVMQASPPKPTRAALAKARALLRRLKKRE